VTFTATIMGRKNVTDDIWLYLWLILIDIKSNFCTVLIQN